MNPKTPTHLDHFCLLISPISFFDQLGATRENMLEEAPVWSRTQEILAHRHESGKIHDGVGGKVMKLCSKEVQESSEERMRRQRKPAVDVSGEENALTLLRPRLGLALRELR